MILTLVFSVVFALTSPSPAHAALSGGQTVTIGTSNLVVLSQKFPLVCSSDSMRGDCVQGAVVATEACSAAGGHLLTINEYADVLRTLGAQQPGLIIERPFNHSGNMPRLTDAGVRAFQALFNLPDQSLSFWTATRKDSLPDETPDTSAWAFDLDVYQGQRAGGYVGARVFYAKPVICGLN